MFTRFKRKPRSMLGVDINPTSIKVLELSRIHNQWLIKTYGYLQLSDKNAIHNIELLANDLKKLLLQMKCCTKSAIVAIPDTQIVKKTIPIVAGLTQSELTELINREAKKQLEYPSTMCIDYAVLNSYSKKIEIKELLVLATRKENVIQRVKALHQAGLKVKVVEVESFAVARVFDNSLHVVIEFNVFFIRLFVIQNRQIIGTEQINNDLSFSIKKILGELFLSNGYEEFSHIFLAGELSNLNEWAELIYQESGIPTTIINPFKFMNYHKNIDSKALQKIASSFLIATGLAMRGFDGY